MTNRNLALWHTHHYRTTGDAMIAAANRNPLTRCWRCNRTLPEHPPHHNGRPPQWTKGHVVDGDPRSPLAPEASTCNYQAGGRLRQARARGTQPRSPNA